MLSEECRTREKEVYSLRAEMDDYNKKMGDFRTELDLAKSQAAVLSSRVARQRRELEEKDQLLLADPVGEANKRAQQIIESATAVSQKMIDDAESMRSRALASVRASYFNAMGFRQELESRYFNLQNDLDQSLRTLRGILRIPTMPWKSGDGLEENYCSDAALVAAAVHDRLQKGRDPGDSAADADRNTIARTGSYGAARAASDRR